jgi:predicted amidohydrolase YtcJ
VGGRIYRATDASPWAGALAVQGGRIIAVGSESSIEPRIGEQTRVVDLRGRLLLPGFTDGHFHLREGARSLGTPPLGEAESRDELLDLVRLHARSRAEGDWILAFGWRYAVLGRPRSREELDSAVSGRPAVLLSEDGRSAWVSSRALELTGISSDSALVSDAQAIAALTAASPIGETASRLREVASHAHRFGITTVQIPSAPSELTGSYRDLDLRIEPLTASPDRPRRDGVERISSSELAGLRGTIVGVHPAKIALDRTRASASAGYLPLRSLVDSGALLVFGSDWPFGTLDPLVGIGAAVTREDLDGRPEGGTAPEQKLTVEEAVLAYTRNGALEPGKPADLAVLSRDIFSIPPRDIAAVRVEMTVFAGRIVYVSPSLERRGPE